MENDEKYRIVKIGFFRKIWYSITKFERYPEMATEGTGRAISYLIKLMLIFSIIVTMGMVYNFNKTIQQGIKYIDENITEITYKDGNLKIKPKDKDNMQVDTNIGTVIIDTEEKNEKQIEEYHKQIQKNNLGILWLNNKVIICTNGTEQAFYYGDLMQAFNISNLEKSDIIQYLQNNKTIYIIYAVTMIVVTFILYILATLIDVLVLSVFGLLTAYIAKIRIRYRAMFNMSVYALTISILLKLLYIVVNMFIDFEVKYFDFMYSAIGFICLAASIFMIKSDVIKQQIELMKVMNEKKEKEENKEEQEKEEPKEDKDKEKKKEDKKEDKKKKEPKVDNKTENQGSEA